MSADDFYFMRETLPKMESIDLYGTTVSVIPDYAFYRKEPNISAWYAGKSVNNVKLPKKLNTIGEYAFASTKIVSIELPIELRL